MASAAMAETLQEAMALAYTNAPALRGENAGLSATAEEVVQARAGYLPSVSVSATLGRLESDDGTTVESTDPKTAALTAVQPLYRGGRTTAAVGLAKAQVDFARASVRSVEQSVLLGAVAAYMDVRRDEQALSIRTSNVTALRRQREAAEIRFKVGEITKTDVAQAEARLSGALAALSGAEAALASSRATYKTLMGQAPGTLSTPEVDLTLPATLDEAISTALITAPSVKAAEANLTITHKAVSIARSAGLPTLSVEARAARANDSLFDGSELSNTSIVASASVPLYAGGAIASGVRQALAEENQARFALERVRRSVEAGVVDAWSGLRAAETTAAASRDQAKAAAFAFEGVEQEAQVGLRTTLDVLDAQQEYLAAQLAVTAAERNLLVSQYALLAAIGRLDVHVLKLALD
jgi:outer membrane protein